MATTTRITMFRKALAVTAVSIAAAAVGASSTIASAAPVTSVTSLDTAANWAVVKQAALDGYTVPAKLWANCGLTR